MSGSKEELKALIVGSWREEWDTACTVMKAQICKALADAGPHRAVLLVADLRIPPFPETLLK